MKHFIKIKSNFNNIIVLQGKAHKLLKNSFITIECNLSQNENFYIEVEPNEKNNSLLFPYKILIEQKNEKLLIDSPNIDVLNYKNYYIVILNKLEAPKNMTVLNSGTEYFVFNTTKTNLTTKETTITLPNLFNSVNLKQVGQNKVFCFKNEVQNYAVVLNNNEILFKDYFSNINLTDKIEILSSLFDIGKHAILTKIENKQVTKKLVYEKSHPKLAKNNKIIPFAFLQALKLDNFKLCSFYLSENLKEIASPEILKSFFKDFKKVEFLNDIYLLFYEDNTSLAFNFKVENSKIVKIECI